jgi:hypothetical protein
MRLFTIGMPNSSSTDFAVATRLPAVRTSFSWMRPATSRTDPPAQSSRFTPSVVVRMSRFSTWSMRSVSRISVWARVMRAGSGAGK